MKKILTWLTALCLLLLSVSGAVAAVAADGNTDTVLNGLSFDADGRVRYYEDGIPVAKGLVRDDDGNIYYIWSAANGAARGLLSIPEDKLNGVLPQGFYEFGSDYRMIVKNGIYTHDWCDKTYYFVDSIPQAVGLAQNEDGDIYYFTEQYGVKCAVTDGDWYISEEETNGLVPEGTYHFNQYGLMTGKSDIDLKPVEPKREEIGENLYRDLDGAIRYYENGQSVAKGLVKDYAGYIYYILSAQNGAVTGSFSIPEDKLNGVLPQGFYEFGSDRRMIVKNGIYTNDWCGYTYYFADSIPQEAGIVTDGEGHYYFFTNIYGVKRAATSQYFDGIYYVPRSATNGLIESGFYRFDADGIMIGSAEGAETSETAKPEEPTETATEKPEDPTETATEKPEDPTETATEKPEDPTETATQKPEDPTETATQKPEDSAEEASVTAEPVSETVSDTGAGTASETESATGSTDGGCSSALGLGSGIALLAAAAVCLARKRRR